jgi:hypothetical protein
MLVSSCGSSSVILQGNFPSSMIHFSILMGHSPLPPVLLEGVRKYMNEIGSGEHEDYMRDFLRYRIQDVGRFLRAVMDVTLTPTDNPNGGLAIALPDTNRAILVSSFRCVWGLELSFTRCRQY